MSRRSPHAASRNPKRGRRDARRRRRDSPRETTQGRAETLRRDDFDAHWPSEREMLEHLERDWRRVEAGRAEGVTAERPCGGRPPLQWSQPRE
jgi:hypothetical protein